MTGKATPVANSRNPSLINETNNQSYKATESNIPSTQANNAAQMHGANVPGIPHQGLSNQAFNSNEHGFGDTVEKQTSPLVSRSQPQFGTPSAQLLQSETEAMPHSSRGGGGPAGIRGRSAPVLPIEKQVIMKKDSKLHRKAMKVQRLSLFDNAEGPNMDDKDFLASLNRCKSDGNLLRMSDTNVNVPGLTKHALYKEALYSGLHMLGKPSERFPCTSEDMCMYDHLIFAESRQEQVAVVEHVMTEPFPLVVVQCRLRRAEGLPSRDSNAEVNPYCLISVQTSESMQDKQWQRPSQKKIAPRNINGNIVVATNVDPEKRFDQLYKELPQVIKTSIQYQTSHPVWDQRFQCLGLRPSADLFTLEVWDHDDEKSTLHALQHAKEAKSNQFVKGDSGQLEDAFYRGKRDNFLGMFVVKLQEIPCDGGELWYNLTGVTHRGKAAVGKVLLQIWLTHAYRHGRHFDQFAEPKLTLGKLWDYVLEHESSKQEISQWDGMIPPAATCLLFQYGLQTGISEASQGLIRWKAYMKHSLGLPGITASLSEFDITVSRASHEKLKEWRVSEIEQTLLCIILDKVCPVLRNHLLGESQERVRLAVESIQHSINILIRFNIMDQVHHVYVLVISYLKLAVLDWYEVKFKEAVQGQLSKNTPDFDVIHLYSEMVERINQVLLEGLHKWSVLFYMKGFIDYMSIMYNELQKMLIFDVEEISWRLTYRTYENNRKMRQVLLKLDEHDTKFCQFFFALYRQTQEFVTQSKEISALSGLEGTHKLVWLRQYHKWFRPILVLWLGFAFIRSSEMIAKSIAIDEVVAEDDYVKTSSSSLDTRVVFAQLTTFWTELSWPDVAENFVVARFLMEVLSNVGNLYAHLKREKLEKQGYFDTVDRFDVSDRLCIALNNIETIKTALLNSFDHFEVSKLMSKLYQEVGEDEAQKFQGDIESLEKESIDKIQKEVDQILNGIKLRIKPEIRDCIEDYLLRLSKSFHLDPEEGLDRLFSYLEDNFVTLQLRLLPTIFIPVLLVFWKAICEELLEAVPHFPLIDSTIEQKSFFTQMDNIIHLLIEYLEGGGSGLTQTDINCEEYLRLREFIDLFQLDTSFLIGLYYTAKAKDQFAPRPPKYGTLEARASYWNGKLTVEVINGKNLIGSDPAGPRFWPYCKKSFGYKPTSDCKVQIDIVPETGFAHAQLQETSIKWKSVDPVYQESFSWQITKAECHQPNAVLRFTVKDFDFLSKNDFLGEAFVTIDGLPGARDQKLGTVTAQPMILILRSKDENQTTVNITEVLKCRHWDPAAQDFLKEEEERVVKPLEP